MATANATAGVLLTDLIVVITLLLLLLLLVIQFLAIGIAPGTNNPTIVRILTVTFPIILPRPLPPLASIDMTQCLIQPTMVELVHARLA
jgi:hypothetical protein